MHMNTKIKEFENHINASNRSLRLGDKSRAKHHLKQATRLMYELAYEAQGDVKETYFARAEKLYHALSNFDGESKPPSYSYEDETEGESESNDTARIQTSNITFDDIIGMNELKQQITQSIIKPVTNPNLFKGYNTPKDHGIFLYGPPGTGKTMMAAAIAGEVDAHFMTLNASDILDKWQGETEKRIQSFFAEARSYTRCVMFFDEMDALMPKDSTSSGAKQARSELLAQIQGVNQYFKNPQTSSDTLLLIGATNKPWDIDPAFLREGRFGDHRIYVGVPGYEGRKTLFEKLLNTLDTKEIIIDNTLSGDELAKQSEGLSPATIKAIFHKAQHRSITRAESTNEKRLTFEDFKAAFNNTDDVYEIDKEQVFHDWNQTN